MRFSQVAVRVPVPDPVREDGKVIPSHLYGNPLMYIVGTGIYKFDTEIAFAVRNTAGCLWRLMPRLSDVPVDFAARMYTREDFSEYLLNAWTHRKLRSVHAFKYAARHGLLDVCKTLHRSLEQTPDEKMLIAYFIYTVICEAAADGRIHVMKWALNVVPAGVEGAWIAAAETGRMSSLKWLKLKGWIIPGDALIAAGKNGYSDALEWLAQRITPSEIKRTLLNESAEKGLVNVIRVLHSNGYRFDLDMNYTMSFLAGSNGQCEMLEFMAGIRILDVTSAYMGAAEYASLEALEWLFANYGVHDNPEIMYVAIDFGGLEIMNWLLVRGFPLEP